MRKPPNRPGCREDGYRLDTTQSARFRGTDTCGSQAVGGNHASLGKWPGVLP